MPDSTSPDDPAAPHRRDVVQYVIHPALRGRLDAWLAEQGLTVGLIPGTNPDDLPTFAVVPSDELMRLVQERDVVLRSLVPDEAGPWKPATHLMQPEHRDRSWPDVENPDALPESLGVNTADLDPLCALCLHEQARHIAVPYVRGDQQRMVVFCASPAPQPDVVTGWTCGCRSRLPSS